jgi:hypothetical protein
MTRESGMNVTPDEQQLWEGIGGHFDSFTQVISEFVDNSVANFEGSDTASTQVLVSIERINDNIVEVVVEDTGTGIDDFEPALRLGDISVGDAPLNEHGFGMKHALASADPDNQSWEILTRTEDEFDAGKYRLVDAPYRFNLSARIVENGTNPWPGQYNGSGTYIRFRTMMSFFDTVQQGIPGNAGFTTCMEYLKEDLGHTYAGVIQDGRVSISLHYDGQNDRVEAVEPTWEGFYDPKVGEENIDLGAGEVEIEYEFGEMKEGDYVKYYKRNMATSGVEIQVNGRVMATNLFPEIWRIERHNAYNHFLAILNLKSDELERLPKTRTAKNGIRSGDEKLEKLFEWIRQIHPKPEKKLTGSISEKELVRNLADKKERHLPDTSRVEAEFEVFDTIDSPVPVDLYVFDGREVTLYEAKKDTAGVQSVYQLLMYWDGAVEDGNPPNEGVLIASDFSPGVDVLLNELNSQTDKECNEYNFVKKTWQDEGVSYPGE